MEVNTNDIWGKHNDWAFSFEGIRAAQNPGKILSFEEINRPHAVYRCYAADGTLLYIGCSKDPFVTRWNRHCENGYRSSKWVDQCTRITAEWFPNWSPACLAEGVAIAEEQPKFNSHFV